MIPGVVMNQAGIDRMTICKAVGADGASKGDGIVCFPGPPNRFGSGGAQGRQCRVGLTGI